jgi:hypothetical protein
LVGTPPAGLKQASTVWTTVARAPLAEREGRAEVIHDYEGGPTLRWVKVKQKGWTDAEDRWQRRINTRVQR